MALRVDRVVPEFNNFEVRGESYATSLSTIKLAVIHADISRMSMTAGQISFRVN